MPTQPNVLRCQFACQWNGDERTERYALNARTFADMASRGKAMGMEGLTVWSEPSDYFATVEISYLAFARFTWDPSLTWDAFMRNDVAPRLGGMAPAERFVALAEELDGAAILAVDRLAAMHKEALAIAVAHEDHVARRWLTLTDQIGRRLHMGR